MSNFALIILPLPLLQSFCHILKLADIIALLVRANTFMHMALKSWLKGIYLYLLLLYIVNIKVQLNCECYVDH